MNHLPDEQQLLLLCDAYCKTMRIGDLRLGQLAGGTSMFFRRLREGRSCTIRKYRDAVQFFSDHWPHGVDWPLGVPRPEPTHPSEQAA